MVTGGEDGLVFADKFVLGSDVSDGGVQAHGVVVLDEASDKAAGLFEVERSAGADAVGFERFMPAFDLAVGLGVVGGGFHMGEPGDADEFLEVFGDELGAVVADDAGLGRWEFFQGALEDDFDVGFGHGLAQLEVDDEARASVKD